MYVSPPFKSKTPERVTHSFSQILREIESRRELCEIELIVFFIHSALHTHISAHDGAGMNILKKREGRWM